MPRSVLILTTISLTAAAAAVVLIVSPKSFRAIFPAAETQKEQAAVTPRRIKAKKPPRRHIPHEGDVDFNYIREFRKCNAGDQSACNRLSRRESGEEGAAQQPHQPTRAQMLATDNTPAPVFATTVFNDLMVRTSVAYAGKVYQCRDQACRAALGRDLEKRRIYGKTLSDAKVACSRRQIEGCSVQADILVAGGEFVPGRDALRRAVELAEAAVSRCDSKVDKDPRSCRASRDWLPALQKREKDLREQMLRIR
jgi:hypothetical protein